MLDATGQGDLARARLRVAVREAEASGQDALRFALVLEQLRLGARGSADVDAAPPTLDDLAALEGLAERVGPGPVARAELTLVRTRVAGASEDWRALEVALAAASAELSIRRRPHRYDRLRFDLALQRADLLFAAGELGPASDAADQAWAIARLHPSHEGVGDDACNGDDCGARTGWSERVVAALQIASISAALRGDCDQARPTLEVLWTTAERAGIEPGVRTRGWGPLVWRVDWRAVRRACPYVGADLAALLGDE